MSQDKPLVDELRSKLQKQRNEIGRLTRLTATLNQQKTDLLFDLNKLRKENEQLREAAAKFPIPQMLGKSPDITDERG